MSTLTSSSSGGPRVWFVDAVGIVIGQPLAGSVLSAPQPIGSSIGAYGLAPGQIVCVAYYMNEAYEPDASRHGIYVVGDDPELTWTKLERQPRPASLATGRGGDVVVIRSGEGFGYRLYPTAWDDGSVLYLDPNRDFLTRWFSTALGLNINPDGSLDGNFSYHAHVVVNDLRNRVRDVLLAEHEVDIPQANEAQVNAALTTVLGTGGGGEGPAGPSAYDIAVSAGFEGDEDAWLLSLVGAQGAAGSDGIDGEDGRSAYQVALDNGFAGTVGEWLASLQGEQGPAGPAGQDGVGVAGPQGEPGAPGAPGEDGRSAYELAVAAGYSGTQPDWLLSLKGEPGQDGADGVGIPGADGVDGSDGVDGADGKSAYQLAVEGGFVGTQAQWLASLKGAKGDTGATGATGATGSAGPAGTPATISIGTVTTGAAGSSASVTNTGSQSNAIFNFTIPRGDQGQQGEAGTGGSGGGLVFRGPETSGSYTYIGGDLGAFPTLAAGTLSVAPFWIPAGTYQSVAFRTSTGAGSGTTTFHAAVYDASTTGNGIGTMLGGGTRNTTTLGLNVALEVAFGAPFTISAPRFCWLAFGTVSSDGGNRSVGGSNTWPMLGQQLISAVDRSGLPANRQTGHGGCYLVSDGLTASGLPTDGSTIAIASSNTTAYAPLVYLRRA